MSKTEVSEFCLQGRFLDFVVKDGYKLKGLLLDTAEGECYVKLAKHIRVVFDWRLPRGTWLEVVGEKKQNLKTGEVKLKASRVMAAQNGIQKTPSISSQQTKTKKATILMCQKSDCMKRGGREVCHALQNAIAQNGLEGEVNIKGTGCMKKCKQGPHLVMPDKTRYSGVHVSHVSILMEKHFATNTDKKSQEVEIPVTTVSI